MRAVVELAGRRLCSVKIHYDARYHQTCPHCAQGQVTREIGSQCRYCGARVVDYQYYPDEMNDMRRRRDEKRGV